MNAQHSRARRTNDLALTYWRELRGQRPYPRPDEVLATSDGQAPADAELTPHFFVVDFDGEPMGSVFTAGSAVLDEAFGTETTGRKISECMPAGLGESMISFVRAMARTKKPITVSGTFDADADGKMLYRSIYMPLSADQSNVDHMLGAFSFKRAANF